MSPINVTTTGSHPPRYKSLDSSIKHVISEQKKAKVHVFVDGQLRSDIVGIFARRIGLTGSGLPYHVNSAIGDLSESVILPDLRIASKYSSGHILKAHITGPTVMAENCEVDVDSPDIYKGETGFKTLVLDIAEALAKEARFIANEREKLGIGYLQIDEPSLAFGADLDLANQAIKIVTDSWRNAGGGPIILHVCGDYGEIFLDLLKLPVDILNLEIEHLDELTDSQIDALKSTGKQLSFGVIPVNTDYIPTAEKVARDVLYAIDRCGVDLIWGITPVCGMRLSKPELVRKRMNTLAQAVNILEGENNINRRGG
jgi:methionine synthase II (cobalamin-independent)